MKGLPFFFALCVFAADPEALVRQVAAYDYGKDPAAVRELEALVLRQGASLEKLLLAGLKDAKTAAAKDAFCRNLAIAGTDASIPALAAMLLDPGTADMARYALESIPGTASTDALREALAKTAPPVQTGIVVSLGRRRDAPSAPAIRRLLQSNDAPLARAAADALDRISPPAPSSPVRARDPERREIEVLATIAGPDARRIFLSTVSGWSETARVIAIQGLARWGTADDVALLADRAALTTGDEQTAARAALGAIPGDAFDAAVLAAIPAAQPKVKVELIRAVGERGIATAHEVLLEAARDTSRPVRVESIRALRETAGPEQVPALLALLENEADRREVERTTAGVIRRSREANVSQVLATYQAATDSALRISLLNILSSVGNPAALPVIRQALAGSDAELQRAALNALSGWPTPEPMDDLIALARSGAPAQRILSLRGYIQLVQLPSNRTPAQTARLLATAFGAATRPDEKRAVLAVAQRLMCVESLELARIAAKDPTVSAEGQLAVTTLERGLSFLKP